jgi:NitT/TauT family transport system substrate-binding protein
VSVLRAIDTAPVWQAVDAGYFREEGLDVQLVNARSGPAALDAVIGDSVKIGFTSYPAAFSAEQKKKVRGGLMIVADGYAAAEETFMILAAPGSGIRAGQPRDLAGKTIAVSATGTISDLGTMEVLNVHGVSPQSVKWKPLAFAEMERQLALGNVDAAVMVEPFITTARRNLGETAPVVGDVASGPLEGIALAGWVATRDFAGKYPRTLAAFQKGLARGVADVKNRPTLDEVMVNRLGVNKDVATILRPGEFPTSMDRTRLERPLNLMKRYPQITKMPAEFEIGPMLAGS